ncbi:LysR family transcriptional regulator [Comamonas aquatilis]|uniref:LysR family transcriptional regulator n=1 Tax=Comamonas aquatilis TaxID=1778406 RepID=UPI0039F0272D
MHIEPLLVSEMLVFAKVVELRSFAAAARQLNLTTSAVSRSVGRLEAHWGVRLLHRTTRSLSLTELGAEVYAGCSQLAATARDVHATAGHYSDTPRGTVRLTAPTVFGEIWLTAQLPALRRRWPEVQLHIALSDQPEDLIAQGLDLAIRIARPEQLPPHMVARALLPVRYIAVATPLYLHGLGGALTHPAQLPERGAQCIALGYGAFQNQLQWQPRDGVGGPLITTSLPAPLTVASSLGITTLALQHQGIGLVADFCAHQLLEQGQLVQLLPDWELTGGYAPRTAYALYMPSRHVPLKVRALIDHLVEAGK